MDSVVRVIDMWDSAVPSTTWDEDMGARKVLPRPSGRGRQFLHLLKGKAPQLECTLLERIQLHQKISFDPVNIG